MRTERRGGWGEWERGGMGLPTYSIFIFGGRHTSFTNFLFLTFGMITWSKCSDRLLLSTIFPIRSTKRLFSLFEAIAHDSLIFTHRSSKITSWLGLSKFAARLATKPCKFRWITSCFPTCACHIASKSDSSKTSSLRKAWKIFSSLKFIRQKNFPFIPTDQQNSVDANCPAIKVQWAGFLEASSLVQRNFW